MYANPCQPTGLAKTPHTRVQNKKFVNVEINTEPWHPECQKCLERTRSSVHNFANNLINVDEYIKAINYINSIHNLINGSLLKQVQTKDGASSLFNNFSMPDLPNFLALLPNLNAPQNCSEKSSQMVSRTTSTSTLPNVDSFYDKDHLNNKKSRVRIKLNSSHSQIHKNDFGNLKPLFNEEGNEVPEELSPENCASQNHFARSLTGESTTETDSSESHEVTQYYIMGKAKGAEENGSRLHQNSGSDPSSIKNYKIINLASSQHKIIYQNDKSMINQQQKHTDKNESYPQKNTDRYKTTPKNFTRHRNTPRKKNEWKMYIPTNFDENKDKSEERTLSDAELDRYASELLYGNMHPDSYASNPKRCIEHRPSSSSTSKSPNTNPAEAPGQISPTGSSTAILRKNLIQNIKEVATKCLEKQAIRSPTRQTRSPTPPYKTKNSMSREQLSNTQKQGCSNSSTTINGLGNKANNLRKISPAETRSTDECKLNNKKESTAVGPKQQRLLKSHAKPPVINLKKPITPTRRLSGGKNHDDLEVSGHISNVTLLPDKKVIILPQMNQPKQRTITTLNKSPTWVVQQKDYDDFVCQVKKTSSKSSDSAILTDEIGQITCLDSDTNDELHDTTEEECNKLYHVQNNQRKEIPGTGNGQNQSHDLVPKERLPPSSIPKPDVRNRPFRQTRKECNPIEEVVKIRNCISVQKKKFDYFDSPSNVSQSSFSSDIKSDRDNSPVRAYERQRVVTNLATGKLHR